MRRITDKEKSLNSILGVNIGLPSLSETGVAVFLTAENLISAYEREASEILARGGYPLTVDELKKVLPVPANGRGFSQIYYIFLMLWHLKEVRVQIEENNADQATCEMAVAVHCAIRARILPILPFVEISEKVFSGGKQGGKKSGAVRREKAKSTKQLWQAEAEKLWRKHPNWKNKSIAELIAKKIGGNPDYIRKLIKNPLP